jgi:hypothetical protein
MLEYILGYSILDKVIFNKTDVFQTNDRIQANTPFQLAGKLKNGKIYHVPLKDHITSV